MTRIEELRSSRESYAVKLREFLRISARKPEAYVVFFEGQDSKYFSNRIEILRPNLKWEGVASGGKDNVLKLYKLIVSHELHRNAKTLYFVDRDFDDMSEYERDARVYVTPGYSVENLYVSRQVFQRILKHEFQVSEYAEGDDTYERCVNAFNDCLDRYLECLLEMNGWVILVRRHEKAHPGTTRLNLNSLKLGRLVHVELEGVTSSYSVEALSAELSAAVNVTQQEARMAALEVPPEERAAKFRGKFQVHFMRSFLAKLVEDANLESPQYFPHGERSHCRSQRKTSSRIFASMPKRQIAFIRS